MVHEGRGGNHQGSQLVFSGGDLASQTVVGYSFVTANDAPERDPSSWRFQGCAMQGQCTESDWINLDIRRSYSAPITRNWETHEFAVGCAGSQTQTQCTSDVTGSDQCAPSLFGQPLPQAGGSCPSQPGQSGPTCQGIVDHHQRAFIAIPKPEAWDSARLLCKRRFGPHADLASIHDQNQQRIAVETCQALTVGETLESGIPHSCWIGLNDVATTLLDGLEGESMFTWVDKSAVDFITFAPGEPNNVGDNGEDVTEVDVRQGRTGAWNDNNNLGEAGNGDDMAGCYGCYGTFGNYPLCETHAPASTADELGHATGSSTTGRAVPHQTCKIDQSRAYVQGGLSGKGCTGTYARCCIPIQHGDTTTAGCGGANPPPSCGVTGGRRALAEATSVNDNATTVTAHPTRVVHTINETKWVSTEELSASDFAIMTDLRESFGDKVYTWGCTASNALNYNPEATMQAGNCEYHPDQPGYTRWY